MLPDLYRHLPYREIGLSYVRSFDGPRFDLASVGLNEQSDPESYQFDNIRRSASALFQYTLDGEGAFHDGRRMWRIGPGYGFFAVLPSATRYGLPRGLKGGPPQPWRFVYVLMRGEAAIAHVQRLVCEHGPVVPLPQASVPVTRMLDLYRRVVKGDPPDELTINIEMYRLLMELTRAMRAPSQPIPEPIASACQLVEQRLGDATLSVDDLADAACYSRYYFTRLFKQHTGFTPYQYLLHQRIRRALELLTTTDYPVKRIASEVGFQDVSWFCHAFHKQMQATPTEVRKQPEAMRVSEVVTVS